MLLLINIMKYCCCCPCLIVLYRCCLQSGLFFQDWVSLHCPAITPELLGSLWLVVGQCGSGGVVGDG